jgi:hypothetical protein
MANKLTKLDAVNIVLSNVGQAPVTQIDNDNPMVALAVNMVDEVAEAVQSEGWVFNYETHYPFVPDVNGEIPIADNIIRIDDSDPYTNREIVVRNGKLYDKIAHSFKFTEKIELDVTWLLEFEDLPQPVKQYIAIRTANLFAGRAVGSQEAVKFGEREEANARATVIQYETEQGDYSFLGTEGNRKIPTYRPFNVIQRY